MRSSLLLLDLGRKSWWSVKCNPNYLERPKSSQVRLHIHSEPNLECQMLLLMDDLKWKEYKMGFEKESVMGES